MTKARRSLSTGLALLGLLGMTIYHASLLGMAPGPAQAGAKIPAPTQSPHTVRLHGSTPTLAWSPDGKRLAVASAFEYWGFESVPKQLTGHTGIYVVDPAARTQWRVSTDQGYHPTWVDKNTLAWGHSPYEDGTPGLYVATLQGMKSSVRRVGAWKGVYHTGLATRGGRVVFFSGFPESKGWVQADLRTGTLTPVVGASTKGVTSWTPPQGTMASQCLQQAGGARAGVTPSGAFLLETRSQTVQIPDAPFTFYNYNGSGRRTSCAVTGHCGAVLPCLSPRGDRVAYVSPGGATGTFTLTVMAVPR